MEHLAQIILLLGVAVAIVLVFQRLHVPTSLGYLLVGVTRLPHNRLLNRYRCSLLETNLA